MKDYYGDIETRGQRLKWVLLLTLGLLGLLAASQLPHPTDPARPYFFLFLTLVWAKVGLELLLGLPVRGPFWVYIGVKESETRRRTGWFMALSWPVLGVWLLLYV